MTNATDKPDKRAVPAPGGFVDTEPFWRGTREGKLLLQYCPQSGRFQHFPRPLSLYTGSRQLEWREVSGAGTVYAHTVLRTQGLGADGRLPLALALIELDEGVRILGNILGANAERARIGARVKLSWDTPSNDARYPAFELE
ncbi:Zn-ribbon domain-containing OB-fold protein [Noviherbaspirillum pedocola]|uniref:Zn-ribbon domain-containing OB-fold protein n=1 Tax=Noviherbaspirillum pedocola TaxID=2801341 RepID=A0A934T052_9BURK|nr:Zn-ribbon domain-containing OB-fold protein [Noviherbaspirillum pedocola]MBK4738530.1 Zn-ribbon domain-containing OB-fold protein [Noviherbaspirillum pedocola]